MHQSVICARTTSVRLLLIVGYLCRVKLVSKFSLLCGARLDTLYARTVDSHSTRAHAVLVHIYDVYSKDNLLLAVRARIVEWRTLPFAC